MSSTISTTPHDGRQAVIRVAAAGLVGAGVLGLGGSAYLRSQRNVARASGEASGFAALLHTDMIERRGLTEGHLTGLSNADKLGSASTRWVTRGVALLVAGAAVGAVNSMGAFGTSS